MPRSSLPRLGALFALALAGCGAPTLSAEDFNQSCAADADCTTILVGPRCDCTCIDAAINRADLPRYTEAWARTQCGGDKLCSPCPPVQARCDAGRCAVRRP
jgi:hypothetical protein